MHKYQWIAVVVALLTVGFFVFGAPVAEIFNKASRGESAALPAATNIKPEFKVDEVVLGTGETALAGDSVVLHYTGRLSDGTKFDSSLDRGAPFEFTLGTGAVIPGFDRGVMGMKVGGKRKITIPAELGYGASQAGPIPPNSTLVFEVELIGVQKAQ